MVQTHPKWLQTAVLARQTGIHSLHACAPLRPAVLQLSTALQQILHGSLLSTASQDGYHLSSSDGSGQGNAAAAHPQQQQQEGLQHRRPELQEQANPYTQQHHRQRQGPLQKARDSLQQHVQLQWPGQLVYSSNSRVVLHHSYMLPARPSSSLSSSGTAGTNGSSSSSSRVDHSHLTHSRSISSTKQRGRTGSSGSGRAAAVRKQLFIGSSDQSHALYDLHDHLAAAAVPERVITAVLSKANTWPSLSRDPVELLNRINRLEGLMGSAAAAHDMIVTHPQLLTRPPAALEQQLHNLVDWLSIPLLPDHQQQQQPGYQTIFGPDQILPDHQARYGPDQVQPDCQALQACQDLMDLIRTVPSCLSTSKDHVTAQLAAVRALLPLLPPLGLLLEDQIKASEQLLQDVQQHRWQQHDQQHLPVREVVDLESELQHWRQQREQRHAYQQAVFTAWRAATNQQQQQQQQIVASTVVDPHNSWPWQLVKAAPEWLFLDPQTTLPRRIDYITKLLYPRQVDTSSHVKEDEPIRSQEQNRLVTNLLLSTPQLISVNTSHIPGKLRVLQRLLLCHSAVKASPDYAYWTDSPQERLVIPTLLQSPLLLLPSAKQLQQQGTALLELLPLLPLHHFLDLLQRQQQLQWQQLQFLQHMHIVPPAPRVQWRQHQRRGSDIDQIWSAWGFDQCNTAVDALRSDPDTFASKYPRYRSWQALSAAVDQSVHNGRESWGWLSEFQHKLTGAYLTSWLSSMQGNWHRLLLLTAGEQWVTDHSGGSSSSSRRSSSTSTSRRTRSSTSKSSSSSMIKLQDVPSATVSRFPVRPVPGLGPMLFDLPEEQQQQLIRGSSSTDRSVLDSIFAQISGVWQQLAAAAAVNSVWQQQLEGVLTSLPEALAAAGWHKPPPAAAAESAGSRSCHPRQRRGSDSRSSRHWIDDVMESRPGAEQLAAAAARHRFWQHIQQPDRLEQLICRLQYLHQVGAAPTAGAAAARRAGISSSSSSSSDLWPVLVAFDDALAADHPQFDAFVQLYRYTEGRSSWRDELLSLHGSDLADHLTQMAAAQVRLDYLTADSSSSSSSSDGGLWQAITLRDTITTSDSHFLEMFPEYRFGSWKALAAMRQGGAAAAAAAKATAAAAAAVQKPIKKRRIETAAQRLQLLQEYAALDRQWSEELATWQQQQWTAAVRAFTPMVARRLEFILRLHEDHIELQPSESSSPQSSSQSGEGSQSTSQSSSRELPSVRTLVATDGVWFNKKYPRFKAWHNIDKAVQAVPKWAAEWQSMKAHQLKQLLDAVLDLQSPTPAEVQQQACEQHLQLLRSSTDSSSSSSKLQLPRELAALQVGVTGAGPASSSLGSSGSSSSKKKPVANQGSSSKTDIQLQQKQRLPGLDLAMQRLDYFIKYRSHGGVMASLSLTDVLTLPQADIAQRYKGLDPQIAAARAQGIADAEARVLQEKYPWLGPKALKPEVLEGLSPEAKRVLEARPQDLLLLQQLAHTRPDWEKQLQELKADGLSRCLTRVRTRAERLQVMVRAGIQQYNSVKSVLEMPEPLWMARYPIATQLEELQAAAQGVATWERTLSHTPSGQDLLTSIDKLHARRGRLAFLQDQDLVEPGQTVLKILQYSEWTFRRLYPEYPGDAASARTLAAANSKDVSV